MNSIKLNEVRSMESPSVIVILPTFNEASSMDDVLDTLSALEVDLHILVVDDASPDGTGKIVREHRNYEKSIFLLSRSRKLGLGSAYKDGFQWGLERDYEIFFEMDSDLSHDPRDIPKFIEQIKQDADLVIGSRYLNGISVINWPLSRLIVSKSGGLVARFFSGVPVTDLTSGFKAFRREVLQSLNWEEINCQGYGFQVEVTFFVFRKGFCIKEIPIIFTERRGGHSKFSRGIVVEALFRIFKLFFIRIFSGHSTR
jgi:dolichol-phosphate mannosyltransferase